MTEPRLYLVTPIIDDADAFRPALDEACRSGAVSAVLLRLAPADERTLVNRVKALAPIAQARDAAVVVADPDGVVDLAALVVRGGADGGHAETPERLADLRRRLKGDRDVGAGGLLTRHDAMTAGELGVDYVMFGETRLDGRSLPFADLEDRAAWWAEIFQTSCVVVSPDLGSVPAIAATGADFVGLADAVWRHEAGPEAAISEALRAIARVPERTA